MKLTFFFWSEVHHKGQKPNTSAWKGAQYIDHRYKPLAPKWHSRKLQLSKIPSWNNRPKLRPTGKARNSQKTNVLILEAPRYSVVTNAIRINPSTAKESQKTPDLTSKKTNSQPAKQNQREELPATRHNHKWPNEEP